MDLRRKAQRWVSVICCTVLLLSAVQVPARRDVAAAQPAPGQRAEQRLAYIGSDHNLWLMNADGSGRISLTQDGLVSMFAWAPDGGSIAVVRGLLSAATPEISTDVALLSLASSTETLLLDDLAALVSSIAWTPDGTRLALLTYDMLGDTASVVQVDAKTGATMILDSWRPEGIGLGIPFWTSGVSWAPNGKSLLVYGYPSRTEVLTVDVGGNSTGSLIGGNCRCPRWAPDGSLIACHDFETIFMVTPDGNLVREHPVSERGWQSPAWSPDGIKIATGGRDGLWAIDTQSGERTHLVTREAWEPSWSPDGQYLAFSLVEGLGGENHELQGIGVIGSDGQGLQMYDDGSYLAQWQPVQVPLEPVCGTWSGSVSDERIALTQVSESAGDECRGAFTFSNETEWWADWGAYTLELEVRRTDNANAAWVTLLAPAESIESTYLLPSLDRELHTFPLDIYSAAQVSVSGEMTLTSITVDMALQALTTAIGLIPGGACWVPEDELAYAAASFAYILAPAARLAWEGDLDGALEELRQLLPQFLERCGDVLKEVAGDCVSAGLTKLLGSPFVVGRLAVECIVWSAKAFCDYWDYQGRPVYAALVYEVPVVAEQFGPGRIVFVSLRDDNYGELYVMDGDGQNQTRLTNTPGVTEWHPAWSPDGTQLAIAPVREGVLSNGVEWQAADGIWVVNLDGSGLHQIAQEGVQPSWHR